MKTNKSTRHAKIAGIRRSPCPLLAFQIQVRVRVRGPYGIDIIARNPHTQEIMGISVKSRTRSEGAEDEYVSIPNENFEKAEAACNAFGCVPYFAIVVDAGDTVRGFILPMATFSSYSRKEDRLRMEDGQTILGQVFG